MSPYGCLSSELFFGTKLGLYVLLGLRMGDINPCPEEGEMEFICQALVYIEELPPGLRQCLLQRLSLSYSIMHSPAISLPKEARECVTRPLRLKDWCRLRDQRCLSTTRCRSIESLPSIEGIRHLRSAPSELRVELYCRTGRTHTTQ